MRYNSLSTSEFTVSTCAIISILINFGNVARAKLHVYFYWGGEPHASVETLTKDEVDIIIQKQC